MIIRIENKTEEEIIIRDADVGVTLASIAVPAGGLTVLSTDDDIVDTARDLVMFNLIEPLANCIKFGSLEVTVDGAVINMATFRSITGSWIDFLSLQSVGYFSGTASIVVDMLRGTLNIYNPFTTKWLAATLVETDINYSEVHQPPIADEPVVEEEEEEEEEVIDEVIEEVEGDDPIEVI